MISPDLFSSHRGDLGLQRRVLPVTRVSFAGVPEPPAKDMAHRRSSAPPPILAVIANLGRSASLAFSNTCP